MTTLDNRPQTALLVVDVQNGVVAGAHERDSVVANIGRLVEQARREHVPVIWVRHSDEQLATGSVEWEIVPELAPGEGEPIVEKCYGDSFEETNLETLLADLGVGRLVVVGAQTDACIRSTLHGALVRGYDAVLVSDAHTTEDLTAWGAPPPDAGNRAHEPLLGQPVRAGADGRDGRDEGRRLRWRARDGPSCPPDPPPPPAHLRSASRSSGVRSSSFCIRSRSFARSVTGPRRALPPVV